jgi:tetraacyldisaccharide 4'-kinase
MDDGFQHRSLKPTATILLTPFDRPFSEDHMLPMGNLREAKSSAARAELIILTKVPYSTAQEKLEALKKGLAKFSNATIFTSGLDYGKLKPVFDTTTDPIGLDQVKACLLITGIAHPGPLVQHLEKHTKVLEHISWPDHHEPSRKELEKARQKFDNFAGLEHIIITTGKDAMRLLSSSYKDVIQDLPVFYLEMSVRPLEEDEFKRNILKYVGKN